MKVTNSTILFSFLALIGMVQQGMGQVPYPPPPGYGPPGYPIPGYQPPRNPGYPPGMPPGPPPGYMPGGPPPGYAPPGYPPPGFGYPGGPPGYPPPGFGPPGSMPPPGYQPPAPGYIPRPGSQEMLPPNYPRPGEKRPPNPREPDFGLGEPAPPRPPSNSPPAADPYPVPSLPPPSVDGPVPPGTSGSEVPGTLALEPPPLVPEPPKGPGDLTSPPDLFQSLPGEPGGFGKLPSDIPGQLRSCFPKDAYTFQALVGGYTNVVGPTRYRFEPFAFRFGKILDCGIQEGCFKGYFEPILELNVAPTQGIGHVFVGNGALLRYNFTQPYECYKCLLVPYIQAGVGIQYNDGYLNTTQTALGQALEYTAQAQIGVHWFVRDNVSVDVEGGYQGMGNLGQATRNGGINAFGGSIGLTYYFPCGHR